MIDYCIGVSLSSISQQHHHTILRNILENILQNILDIFTKRSWPDRGNLLKIEF